MKTTAAGPAETPSKEVAPAKAMPRDGVPKTKGTAPKTKRETKPAPEKSDLTAKAASILAQGQALEKSGKTQVALTYYQRVVKEFPETPAAKTASAKIKTLGGK